MDEIVVINVDNIVNVVVEPLVNQIVTVMVPTIPVVVTTPEPIPVVVNTTGVNISVDDAIQVPVVVGVQGPQGVAGETTVSDSVTKVAGEILGGNRGVTIGSNGKAYYADNTIVAHANKVLGVTKGSAILDANVDIQTYGVMVEPSWNWDLAKMIFIGPNGTLVQDMPASGFALVVGWPLSTTSMMIDIDKPIIL